ncbi:hypothetical protein CAOG_04188 [Capsaspora owczarzaki ATCC 30864]|uniref:Uncharacterized protein n=1 Tax=Capsaspora owczarzaki (strain ATCC 30864) TaxID=595528 RepID=A0A0D2WPL6_CAPO3|nr:hypothetical protein CAOG_04188 [Capsaspora owczarzaki ATCC 30864]KJE93395.1 hypothetical protein CAOG_004188 [Capsaspora owczarzaki ATCC 30864]|eukprot:XP_004348013.1 hypothetical protein CAOG_04188 [Capsaspora owczarzaki ATCC 30864]
MEWSSSSSHANPSNHYNANLTHERDQSVYGSMDARASSLLNTDDAGLATTLLTASITDAAAGISFSRNQWSLQMQEATEALEALQNQSRHYRQLISSMDLNHRKLDFRTAEFRYHAKLFEVEADKLRKEHELNSEETMQITLLLERWKREFEVERRRANKAAGGKSGGTL